MYIEKHKKELIELSKSLIHSTNLDFNDLQTLGYDLKAIGFIEGYLESQKDSKPKLFSEALPKQYDSIIVYGINEEAREVEFDKNLLGDNNIYLIKEYSFNDDVDVSYHYSHWKPVDKVDY